MIFSLKQSFNNNQNLFGHFRLFMPIFHPGDKKLNFWCKTTWHLYYTWSIAIWPDNNSCRINFETFLLFVDFFLQSFFFNLNRIKHNWKLNQKQNKTVCTYEKIKQSYRREWQVKFVLKLKMKEILQNEKILYSRFAVRFTLSHTHIT